MVSASPKRMGNPYVLLGDGAELVELAGAGDGGAQGDGVHAVFVAEPVALNDGGQVVHAAGGAEAPACLVLGSFAEARVRGVFGDAA